MFSEVETEIFHRNFSLNSVILGSPFVGTQKLSTGLGQKFFREIFNNSAILRPPLSAREHFCILVILSPLLSAREIFFLRTVGTDGGFSPNFFRNSAILRSPLSARE